MDVCFASAVVEILPRMQTIKREDNVFILDLVHLVWKSERSLKFSGVAADSETEKQIVF